MVADAAKGENVTKFDLGLALAFKSNACLDTDFHTFTITPKMAKLEVTEVESSDSSSS